MKEQIDRDVMRTHPDMHFFSGSDQAATQHREVGSPRHEQWPARSLCSPSGNLFTLQLLGENVEQHVWPPVSTAR